jgi:hypothetical protein
MRILYSVFSILLLFQVVSLYADTTKQGVSFWHINENFGDIIKKDADTIALNYHAKTIPVYNKTIGSSWLGNLGLPSQSMIYFDRNKHNLQHSFLFRDNYLVNFISPEDIVFYNTKTPFSNITYHTGGFSYREEDNISGLFTVNATPKLNFSLQAKHIYGRGAYQAQGSDGLSGALYGSYLDNKYGIHFIAALNNLKHFENGGIADISLLNTTIESYNLPTNLSNAWSIYNSFYLYASHYYNIGFTNDQETFIPVTTIGHTISYEQNQKKYYENSIGSYYQNNYYSTVATNDTASYNVLKNVAYISLNEGFHKWALMGIRAFVEMEVEEQTGLTADWTLSKEQNIVLYAGGEISKTKCALTYNALGKLLLVGDERGGYELSGDVNTKLMLGQQEVSIGGKAFLLSSNPSYFMENYYSNHFIWERNFSNTLRSHVCGFIKIPNKNTTILLKAGVENIHNYLYFDTNALPAQYENSIQVLHGEAKLNIHIGNVHLENAAIFQTSSHENILPLPSLSSYHNVYYTNTLFKVLNMQLGADCRFHAAYYANAYMPATGQYYRQTDTLIGNYPFINLYANFHLKRTRFFVMYYNLSEAIFANKNYMLVPNYPLNPGMIKFGLSWNFYD